MSIIKNENGQSTVEYILLLAVLISISVGVMNSQRMKDFLGPNSELFGKLKDRFEYSYRHGNPGLSSQDGSEYTGMSHETYVNLETGGSRFFLSLGKYPE